MGHVDGGIPYQEALFTGKGQMTFRILGPGLVAGLHQGNGFSLLPGKEAVVLYL
jgi:hypothetical protein